MPVCLQVPSIVLPTVWTTGTETENLNDLVEHTSVEFPTENLTDVTFHVYAAEAIAAGAIGDLHVWVEVSPYLSTTSAAYWAAIGGGGGAIAPTAPFILAGTGVHGTVHTFYQAFSLMHAPFCRIVAQMPACATPLTSFWAVQIIVSGKGRG